jgi:peptide/nickel transport system substrate-binding protein
MWRLLPFMMLLAFGCGRCSRTPQPAVASREWSEGIPEPELEQPKSGGTLRVRLAAEPAGLTRFHDGMADGVVSRLTLATVYEALGRVSTQHPEGALEPWLATGWESLADGPGLRLHLRQGVRFHDGSAFDAQDVIATIAAVRLEANPTVSWRQALGAITSVVAVDALTLEIRWASRTPFAERALLAGVPMLSVEQLAQPFETARFHRQPVGTGPFRLESWRPNERLRFVRAETAWGTAPWLEAIEAVVIRDETVALASLRAGEIDVLPRISAATWRALEAPTEGWAVRDLRRVKVMENTYSWIGFNQRKRPFDEVAVRRALAAAYPEAAVSRLVDLGLEPRTSCPFLFGSASCDSQVAPVSYAPETAKALLADAGWVDADDDGVRERDGQPLAFSFLVVAGGAKMVKLAPLYQEALAAVGVQMRIETVENAAYLPRLRAGDFDAAGLQWSSPDGVLDASPSFHSLAADGGSNYVGFRDAEADRLLEAIAHALSDGDRQSLERKLHRRLVERQASLFLTARPSFDVAARRVHGLVPSLSGYRFSQVWVSE